jgi:hypothetical protein
VRQLQKPSQKSTPKLIIIIGFLILLSLACNLPLMAKTASGPEETARIEISVRKTVDALDGDQSGQEPEALPASETSEPDITDTLTLTPAATDTPTLTPTATDTPTPEMAMIYASANTNCRTGQGTFFEWLVTMQEGEVSEAVGVDTSGEYWYIRRPDNPSQFCWLWGKYATPSGPYESLPVFTPIPTPTPGFDFTLSYSDITQCTSNWLVQFQIVNNGSFTLESWESSGTDNSGGLINSPNQQDKFYRFNHCTVISTQNDLTPGEGSYLNAIFSGDTSGHNLTINIKVCSENGIAGECRNKTFDITP